jgi:hypothetical protein
MSGREEFFKERLIQELSQKLPQELVSDLVLSYKNTLVEYRKGRWEETLCRAGKFAENVFRILSFLQTGKLEKEAPSFKEIRDKLESNGSKGLPESIRILIPRIATSMIYTPRSKRAAVHVKEISPDYMDATLALTACTWILAEFIRLYHTSDSQKISEIINELMQRKVPFIEVHEGRTFVTKPIDCKTEILLLLLNSRTGLDRTTLGEILGRYYTQARITQSIKELEKKRYILRANHKYLISGPGEGELSKKLSELL